MLPETPRFWQRDNWLARLLSPLSCFYYLGYLIKTRFARPYTSKIPVLCLGGVVAGGSGKTPTLHAFAHLIQKHGLYQKPVILLRGYGGRITAPTLVDLSTHTYTDVGDEALLHASILPTIVSADRAAGAKLAEQIEADIILMDDGLQNNSLTKTVSILVYDSQQGLGNGRLLPAGPLREPLAKALAKTSAIVQIGKDRLGSDKPVIDAKIISTATPASGKTYLAFAGLGRPEKFKATLKEQGFRISEFVSFPDHHPYDDNDIKKLTALAEGKTLITTAKDWVRIPAFYRYGIEVLPVVLQFNDENAALNIVKGLS